MELLGVLSEMDYVKNLPWLWHIVGSQKREQKATDIITALIND